MDGNSTDKALSSKPIGCITLTFITYPKFCVEKIKDKMMKNPRMSITTSSDFYNFNAIIINKCRKILYDTKNMLKVIVFTVIFRPFLGDLGFSFFCIVLYIV